MIVRYFVKYALKSETIFKRIFPTKRKPPLNFGAATSIQKTKTRIELFQKNSIYSKGWNVLERGVK